MLEINHLRTDVQADGPDATKLLVPKVVVAMGFYDTKTVRDPR